ncbi:hypothetical protein OUW_16032 [Mycobacteroides abscessus M93]|nr:hypothetical protein OUW_16032 [Mycobacteroides abscessus M93]
MGLEPVEDELAVLEVNPGHRDDQIGLVGVLVLEEFHQGGEVAPAEGALRESREGGRSGHLSIPFKYSARQRTIR